NGFWDYGPLGVLLKNNIRDWWWRNMVECPPIGPDGHPIDMVGVDTAIIQNPKTWVASGHAGGFSDPMVDDKGSKQRFRADHLIGLFPSVEPGTPGFEEITARYFLMRDPDGNPRAVPVAVISAASLGEAVDIIVTRPAAIAIDPVRNLGRIRRAEKYNPAVPVRNQVTGLWVEFKNTGRQFCFLVTLVETDYLKDFHDRLPSPTSGKPGQLTEPRQFNLMLTTEIGAVDPIKAYLRPETAQGIFLNFKNIIDTTRVKVPFGVAQVGKSFRNEVTPRNFIFRSREFEQMEMEWFCHPDEAVKWYQFWKQQRMNWWYSLGVDPGHLRFRDHEKDELSHYSKMTVDIEYLYPFTAPDFGELEGIAHRGCFDLTQHQQHSGQKLDYFDQELQLKLKEQGSSPEEIKAKSRYIPNVIEPASGLTRAVLVLLCEAYRYQKDRQGTEEFLSLRPRFAPIKLGIFPLVNKEGMPEVAEKLYLDLRTKFTCEYDPKQSIGKRYARMDEIGTPFCVTIDGQTLTDGTVTIRQRDTMQQDRIATDKIESYVRDQLQS
ncbi:MAG TPA: glycine--tRNA ligase, partial [Tepidisphaeraceae bacterium]|nr:glycine--tRNA ligase [Tepidisphaeraceae bacterium]